jgi:aminoglycoside phosphotransferase (APT) family kinase protein
MAAESAVLASVGPALAEELLPSRPEDLVIVREAPVRRRSSLYFLGVGAASECRWVLKRPHSQTRQPDLPSPLSAAHQFASLQRLHDHLQRTGGRVATPRPVAYVAELDGYVMEYVAGPTLTALITPRAVLQPRRLLAGVAEAAAVLEAVHSLEPAPADVVDVPDLVRDVATRSRRLLASAGLPLRERWFVTAAAPRTAIARTVLLHGDFAPENIVLSPSGPYCLEPDLGERGWPEHDVARFLLMLFDAPLFVVAGDVPPVRRLRRAAADRFLLELYRGGAPSPILRPLLVGALAARWAMRHTDVVARDPGLRPARELLLRRHFGRLLDEVSSPDWLRPLG